MIPAVTPLVGALVDTHHVTRVGDRAWVSVVDAGVILTTPELTVVSHTDGGMPRRYATADGYAAITPPIGMN